MSESPLLFSSDDEDEGPCQEAKMLKKFQLLLQGVPPPSSVTMCRLSVSDILKKYKENESLFDVRSQAVTSHRFKLKNNLTPLMYYSNSSQISEEIADLSQKVQSRYIYSETMSTCNVWFDTVVKTSSAKNRSCRRNSFGFSPGSRLSHLARRRQIFSCENLQQLANSDKRRHIEIKKQTALKSRTFEKNKMLEGEKINSFKRALFLSPDDEDSKGNLNSMSVKRDLFLTSDKSKSSIRTTVGVSKQFLSRNSTEESSKKKRRSECREPNGSWPRRALTFSEEDSDKNQETRNAKVISEVQLSLHHKSKLLWAVSVTLKENNMSSKDPQFKTCASALFMICRKNLGKILSSKKEGGTSESMLHFAREQIGGIFRKLGISRNDSFENQNVNVLNAENSKGCSVNTKENLNSYNEMLNLKDSISDSENNESSLSLKASELNMSFNEKENIDVPESKNFFS